MASLDDLKKRIASVKSTQKITKAMKMVAAAKLRRAQESAEKGRPYSEKMNNIILNLSSGISDKENAPKLLSGSGNDKVHLCVVMTSDRGLCGGFNSNIIKKAKSYFAKLVDEGKDLKIITVGSKGNDQLKRAYGDKIIANISFKESKHANYFDAEKVGKMVIEKFEAEEFDVCTIFYNLENSASEQGSRMSAMDNATRNAGEMVDKLTIEYNRSRQAAITKELIEIISGAESL
jgi:F-type H+-transporting ATPase subunit gamma